MKSSGAFLFVIFLCFGILTAAAYFVLYAPLIEQHKKDQMEILDKLSRQAELSKKKQELENYNALAKAYISTNQLYEYLLIPSGKDKPEASDIDIFFNILGRHTIGNDTIRPQELPAEIKIGIEETYSPYKGIKYKIDSVMTFTQVNQLLSGIMKSTDIEYLKQIDYTGANREEVLKPKLILIRGVDMSPAESLSLDEEFAKIEDPLQVRIEVEYIYFQKL